MRRLLVVLGALVVAALTIRARLTMEAGLDYFGDASASIDALVRRDWQEFAGTQPLMGTFSLFLRAPFVAPVFHGSVDTVYYAGALPCVLATVILGIAIARPLAARGYSPVVQVLAGSLAVFNPLTFRALHWGHPEELLAGALCVGAVLAALSARELLAAVLLGLALATKQWTVLAILPVLLAAPRRRLAVALIAGAIATALTLPILLADAERFQTVTKAVAGGNWLARSTTPWNVWMPLADLTETPAFGRRYMAPQWVTTIAHPLIVLLAIPLSAVVWRRRDRRADDALLLLAVLLLLRCLLDNWNNEYYHAPFLLALLAWETVRRPGVPHLTLAVTVLLGLTFWPTIDQMYAGSVDHAQLSFALYTAWAVPLALALVLLLLSPGRARSVAAAVSLHADASAQRVMVAVGRGQRGDGAAAARRHGRERRAAGDRI